MLKKKELTKCDRKRLELSYRKCNKQRKENRKEINRLINRYPGYYLMLHGKAFLLYEMENSSSSSICGESIRGILA